MSISFDTALVSYLRTRMSKETRSRVTVADAGGGPGTNGEAVGWNATAAILSLRTSLTIEKLYGIGYSQPA